MTEPEPFAPPQALDYRALQGDCARCFGLCCVALPYAASADFAADKPAGQPCRHLAADFRCGIHERLRTEGYRGCTVYDCFGAGQKVSQETFGGVDWRAAPETAKPMFDVFPVMRQLYEMLRYLAEAMTLKAAAPIRGKVEALLRETERLTRLAPDALLALDVPAHRDRKSTRLNSSHIQKSRMPSSA